ncbi:hypothetical protein [Janthinobacterium sp. HLX7-2]|uniref:hypothetical protein n=1 Tax=Janthinobacterium sp. HLX7-2 TaxID=1259331 RepID=UPI003F1E4B65
MSCKEVIAFYGNVSQVVVGNVIEVARQSKAVCGARIEFQALTKLQRQDVTAKVKAWVARDGGPTLDVYRVLPNNLGAASMNAFPCDKYMAAIPCAFCARQAADIKLVRAMVVAQWALLLGAILLCGWLLLPSTVDTASKSSAETRCFIDGKAYSIGSSNRMPNGTIRECMNNGMDGVPRWTTGVIN